MGAISIIHISISSVIVYVAFYHFDFWRRWRGDPSNLWFAILCLFAAAYCGFDAFHHRSQTLEAARFWNQFSVVLANGVILCLHAYGRAGAKRKAPELMQ